MPRANFVPDPFKTGQAMTSCLLQSNYSSTVTLHCGPIIQLRPVRTTLCLTPRGLSKGALLGSRHAVWRLKRTRIVRNF